MSPYLRSTAAASCTLVLCFGRMEAGSTTRAQSDSFAKKLAIIQLHAEELPQPPRRTTVTEDELNSWFVYRAPELLPAGVKDPRVAAAGNGRLAGTVIVDLEDVGKARSSGGAIDPWKYLGGRVTISLSGILTTAEGRGEFRLQSARIAGVPLPKFLLQEIVAHYTRADGRPDGIQIEDPFDLPAAIRQIDVGQGQAIVLQ